MKRAVDLKVGDVVICEEYHNGKLVTSWEDEVTEVMIKECVPGHMFMNFSLKKFHDVYTITPCQLFGNYSIMNNTCCWAFPNTVVNTRQEVKIIF